MCAFMEGQLRLDGPLAKRLRVTFIEGGDELVIFSHGFGTDQSVWSGVLERLPRKFSILLYDLPGACPHLPPDFDVSRYRSLSTFSDELLQMLDEVKVKQATFVGHSVSGMIGALAAIEDPLRFRKLILLNASPRYLDDDGYRGGFSRQELDGLFNAMASNYQAWVTGFAPVAVGDGKSPAVEDFKASLLAMRPDVALQIARVIFESDVRAILPMLRPLTVLIHARADVAVPEQVAKFLAQHIPNSQLAWIPVTGHLPHLSAPDQIADILGPHLAA
jgi:pimeloyl-ACP methyl ester carboxylesterase